MIILIYGGFGSGKTISAVRNMVLRQRKCFVNFPVKLPTAQRLKMADIIKYEKRSEKTHQVVFTGVNWAFWQNVRNKYSHYGIYLDEVHNIIHSRLAMTKRNIFMTMWMSQIRKILQDDDQNDLVLITQRLGKVDIDFRELAQVIIKCKKVYTNKGNIRIVNEYYDDLSAAENNFKPLKRVIFDPTPYYKFYNTLSIVNFGDDNEYL